MVNITLELYLLSNFNIAKDNYKFAYKTYKNHKKLQCNNIDYYRGVVETTRQILLKAAFDLKYLKQGA